MGAAQIRHLRSLQVPVDSTAQSDNLWEDSLFEGSGGGDAEFLEWSELGIMPAE
jgi:hypothetical protein